MTCFLYFTCSPGNINLVWRKIAMDAFWEKRKGLKRKKYREREECESKVHEWGGKYRKHIKNNRIYNEKLKPEIKCIQTKIHTKFLANCHSWLINSHAASDIYKFLQFTVGKILALNINYLSGYTMFPNGKCKL